MKEKIRDIIYMHFLMLEDPNESNEMKKRMLKEVPEHLAHDLNLLFEENSLSTKELGLIFRHVPFHLYLNDHDGEALSNLFTKLYNIIKQTD